MLGVEDMYNKLLMRSENVDVENSTLSLIIVVMMHYGGYTELSYTTLLVAGVCFHPPLRFF